MNKDFITAVEEIEREKGISKEILFEAIESALVSAYKKNYGTSENVLVKGRVVQFNAPENILQNPANAFDMRFVTAATRPGLS